MVGAGGGASADTLNQGRHIFTQPCTSCHEADPLGNHSMPEWRSIVSEMAPKAKLDPARRAALLAYIGAAKAVGPTATPH